MAESKDARWLSASRSHHERWNARYDALVQYGDEHGGDCNIPQLYKCTLNDGKEVN